MARRRGHPRSAAPRRRAVALAAAAGALALTIGLWGALSGGSGPRRDPRTSPGTVQVAGTRTTWPVRLRERSVGTLGASVEDAAAAPAGAGALLLGGLTAGDTSRSDIVAVVDGTGAGRGRLPGPVHDAAAATLGGRVYLFGGGNGTAQLDAVLGVDPGTGAVRDVGRLPAPSSDQAAAALGGVAYVVGGFTGARWLDTVVAWRPGRGSRVAGRLPGGLRYAAVAAAAGRVIIAGGSRPDGTASDAVLAFDPGTGKVTRLGRLPAPTTHAAAAALGDTVYVIGGRGATPGSATGRIVAVDARTGRVRSAGQLASPRSDLAAVGLQGKILLAGGRGAGGTLATLSELVPVGPARATARSTPVRQVRNVYWADGAGQLRGPARHALHRIYVPNSQSDTLDVIDPSTDRVVAHYGVGGLPQHVVPSWDLRTLYVTNDTGNSLTPIDPRTGRPGRPIPVRDPYNLYFTPDGRYAIVVAERYARLDFRDPHGMRLRKSVPVPCRGVDHLDFTADGRRLVASCEFSGQLVTVDLRRLRVTGVIRLPRPGAMPQDVKLSPDGRLFYVADMMAGGLWEIDAAHPRVVGFLPTGQGAHGLYPSRDGRLLYVSNRGAGTVSVVSFATRRVVRTWRIPGGSPDMGGVSADGRVLWLSGRYDAEVYAIDTATGRLLARIPVGQGPHGLSVWPQPGRHSLGHTGIMR